MQVHYRVFRICSNPSYWPTGAPPHGSVPFLLRTAGADVDQSLFCGSVTNVGANSERMRDYLWATIFSLSVLCVAVCGSVW